MRRTWLVSLVTILLMLAMAVPLYAADNPPLTADEAKKLVDAGQYQDALKALMRILDLRGAAAAPYNRHEMLMLRAECLLQTRQNTAALDTLEMAKKEAAAAVNDDDLMEASALAMLIKASPGGNYTPLTGAARKPVPILDRVQRKAAYDALLADQLPQVKVKAAQAKVGDKLPPLADAAKQAAAIRPIEKMSVGDTQQTDEMLAALSAQAQKMITTAVDNLTDDTNRIRDAANEIVTEDVSVMDRDGNSYDVPYTHRVGLAKGDGQTLRNIIAETGKIAPAANELAQFFTSDAAAFKAESKKAAATCDRAKTVLNDDYSKVR